jgi:hypothetical protein
MADNGQTGWPEVYSKAMWEIEDALLAGRVWDVRAEISKRLVELQALPGMLAEERQAIADALRCLQSLERDEQRHNAAAIGKIAWGKVSSISPRFAPQASSRA